MFMNSLTMVEAQLLAAAFGGVIGGMIGSAIMLVVFWFYSKE